LNIIFLGLPGSGKSTQGNILSKTTSLPWVSIGELLREEFRKGTSDGLEANKYLSQGLNCPTEIKIRMLEKILNEARNGFILDNYPRTRDDLKHLKKYLKISKKKLDAVILLKTKESDVIERLMKKGQEDNGGKKRNDTSLENIKKRIEKGFKEDADYILSFFHKLGVLKIINGGEDIEAVSQNIQKMISTIK
jgi:adenylate kinase